MGRIGSWGQKRKTEKTVAFHCISVTGDNGADYMPDVVIVWKVRLKA
jgi:hypothetical protein